MTFTCDDIIHFGRIFIEIVRVRRRNRISSTFKIANTCEIGRRA